MEAHTDTTTNAGQILAMASGGRRRAGDRVFSNLAIAAGVTILALLAGVAIFLLVEAMPAITADSSNLPEGKSLIDYIAPLAFGTVLAATLAVVFAVPLAVAVALFISHIAPKRLVLVLGFFVDLLAAVPSVIYGLWGIFVLGPAAVPVLEWLEQKLGFIPFFEGPASVTGRTMLVAGIVLTVMILPIVSAVAREVFSQTPRKLQEGALALGATRWEMIRMTVLPFGKSSVISGAMLGLGRALGETMAVTIILSVSGIVTFNLISQANPSTIAANIALDFPESSGIAINTLIASGLVLFAITLVTNLIARAIIVPPDVRIDGGPGRHRNRRSSPASFAAARCRAGPRTASSPARLVFSALALLATGAFSIALLLVFATVVSCIAIYAWSRAVEGSAAGPRPPGHLRDHRRLRPGADPAHLAALPGDEAGPAGVRLGIPHRRRRAASSAAAAPRTRSSARS